MLAAPPPVVVKVPLVLEKLPEILTVAVSVSNNVVAAAEVVKVRLPVTEIVPVEADKVTALVVAPPVSVIPACAFSVPVSTAIVLVVAAVELSMVTNPDAVSV